MIRKMLLVAAAIAMPVSVVAGVAVTSGVAGAKAPVVKPTTCSVTGSVTFPAPGLSKIGSVESSSKSTTTSTTTASGGCTGTNSETIVSKSTVKCKSQPTTAPCTSTAGFVYDTESGFATSVPALATAVKKGLAVVDNGVALTLVPTPGTGVSQIIPGSTCGSNAGFLLTGTVKKATDTFTATICLTSDTGPGTSGTFITDLLSGAGTIATASIGGLDSTIVIN
jgi:hypothetical protein